MTFRTTLLRIGAAAGFALAVLAVPAQAQTPQDVKIKLAREVMEASGATGSFDNIIPIFLDEAKRSLQRTQAPELGKDFDAVVKILQPEFQSRRDQLVNEVAIVYADRFSEEELNDIKTFYLSPSGRKLTQVLPGVLQASFAKTETWSRIMSQDVITRMRAEMKKKGHNI